MPRTSPPTLRVPKPKSRGPTNRRTKPPQKQSVGDRVEYLRAQAGTDTARGILELHSRGYGFLRDPNRDYARQTQDPYVPARLIPDLQLAEGVELEGHVRPAQYDQGPRLLDVTQICGRTPAEYADVQGFETLTAISPYRRLGLETGSAPLTTRVIDLLTPIGFGQRGLIVAPPKTGKTTLLRDISTGVTQNHPGVRQVVLLIDERPEEVTDFRRQVRGEVVASSLDETPENHVRLTQLAVKRCQRLAEAGEDVLLLIDSLTRIARAFNKCAPAGQALTSGGINIRALDIPKRVFAAARQFAEGGSLTILATALIDTGSRGDEVVFQEFKGTGNMEIVLDRGLADRRIWPAIDMSLSGTRRDELLLLPETLECTTALRRALSTMRPLDAMEELTRKLARFPSNHEFLDVIRHVRSAE